MRNCRALFVTKTGFSYVESISHHAAFFCVWPSGPYFDYVGKFWGRVVYHERVGAYRKAGR